jgi:hypothetical protein
MERTKEQINLAALDVIQVIREFFIWVKEDRFPTVREIIDVYERFSNACEILNVDPSTVVNVYELYD